MPLAEGSSAATISKNVAELIRSGRSQAEAAAIAYKAAGKDEAPKMAAGTLYMAPDGDVLILRRSSTEKNYAGHWGLPGGGAEDGETPEQAAHREATEEMGTAPEWRGKKISETATPNGMVFHTFAHPVAEKFQPKLNSEHSGFTWSPLNDLPHPLHPALKSTLRGVLHGSEAGEDCAQDMTPDDWHGLVHGFLKFISEEEQEPEHQAADAALLIEGDDPDGQLARLLDHIGKTAAVGHSFNVVVDPGDSEHERSFGIDGDGAFRITSVKEVKGKQAADAENPAGKLTEAEQAEAAQGHVEREEMPASAFLEPGERKYPVKESKDGEWKYSRNLLLAAAREARMHGHEDLANRADKIRNGMAQDHDRFALDKDVENRTKTVDNRLIVKRSIFSEANICGYLGSEVPDWESLGLDPEKVYRLFRDPVELRKAAPTFDKVPVLLEHVPSTADDHPTSLTVGTTGEKTRFEAPYLIGSLAIWDSRGIDAIESGKQSAISLGYRYRALMVPGTMPNGERWDGKMVDIVGNHLALVVEPRVESAMVGDSNSVAALWDIIEEALTVLLAA